MSLILFIQSRKKRYHVLFWSFELATELNELGEHSFRVSLWEGLWLSPHVFLGISIGFDDLESPFSDVDCLSDLHVSFAVLFASDRVFVAEALEEFSTPNTGVSLRSLIHLDRVIPAVERQDESFIIRILNLTQQPTLKPQYKLILLKHFINILSRWFRVKTINRTQ